jgi:hypothetical protein
MQYQNWEEMTQQASSFRKKKIGKKKKKNQEKQITIIHTKSEILVGHHSEGLLPRGWRDLIK